MRFYDHQPDVPSITPAPPAVAEVNLLHGQANDLFEFGDDLLDDAVDRTLSQNSVEIIQSIECEDGQ